MLVATDVAARGLDVKDIAYVINYDFPVDGVEVSLVLSLRSTAAHCVFHPALYNTFKRCIRGKAQEFVVEIFFYTTTIYRL